MQFLKILIKSTIIIILFHCIKIYKILTIAGNTCPICPVNSNTMTDVDMVCVTLPDNAAAPTTWTQKQIQK